MIRTEVDCDGCGKLIPNGANRTHRQEPMNGEFHNRLTFPVFRGGTASFHLEKTGPGLSQFDLCDMCFGAVKAWWQKSRDSFPNLAEAKE